MIARQALSEFKLNTGYFKWIQEKNRRETWQEACERVFDMHKRKFSKLYNESPKFKQYVDFAEQAYKDKRVLASMRSLQFGGSGIEKHNARMFNCLSSYCDRPKFFNECMYWLLCGCGVGFSVQRDHIFKLPAVKKRTQEAMLFEVPDSIEGWSDAIGVLLSSYFEEGDVPFPQYRGKRVHFDFSKIRPKGSYISGGFKAPGPDGLRQSILKIEQLLYRVLEGKESVKLSPIVAYDIVMHISDAVLSGGVRRSATICLFSQGDEEMLNAKTDNWYVENPQRARSNNSVVLFRDLIREDDFHNIISRIKDWGEPGFFFSDDPGIVPNPCVEIGLYPQTEDGVSGWQGCNLTEGNGMLCKTKEDFLHMCKASAIIGTLQASYTNFKYVGEECKQIFDREALLGCSITGMTNNPDICFDPAIQREGAELIKTINAEVAEMIGINPAARTTCVKPSGNSSVALGCASGIHGEHSRMYLRNVQANKEEDVAQMFARLNPKAVEESKWSANQTDLVLSFPITTPPNSLYKEDLLGVRQLKLVSSTQNNWVQAGTRPNLCVYPFTRHNVSNTINVDDWDAVERYIYTHRHDLAGVSLLSSTGDKDYVQAPFIAIYEPDELIDMYGDAAIFAAGLVVDGLHAFDNLWDACSQVLGFGKHNLKQKTSSNALMRDWVRRAKQFAERYFQGDVKHMTYCLKDVHNYHRWVEISRDWKDIDYSTLTEPPAFVDVSTLGAIACQGGACEI